MPKGKNHTPVQIVAILRRVDQGETAEAICRNVNISEATLYRWKQQYGAMEIDEVKELKALREENARLKRLVADQVLNIQVLKEVNAKMVSPSQRRHAAHGVVAAGLCSRRQACRYLGLARSSLGYRRRRLSERRVQTEAAIVELSRRHPRYGYRCVHALVVRRGLAAPAARCSGCAAAKVCAYSDPHGDRRLQRLKENGVLNSR